MRTIQLRAGNSAMMRFRINPIERATIRQAAKRHGMTIQAFITRACRVLAQAEDAEALAAIERAAKRAGGKA